MIEAIVVGIAFVILAVASVFHFWGYKSDDPNWYEATDEAGCKEHHQHLWQITDGTLIVEGKPEPKDFNWCPYCKAVRE